MAVGDYRSVHGGVWSSSLPDSVDAEYSGAGAASALPDATYGHYAGLTTRTLVIEDSGAGWGRYQPNRMAVIPSSGARHGHYQDQRGFVSYWGTSREVSVTTHNAGDSPDAVLTHYAGLTTRTFVIADTGSQWSHIDPRLITNGYGSLVVDYPSSYFLATQFQGILNQPLML